MSAAAILREIIADIENCLGLIPLSISEKARTALAQVERDEALMAALIEEMTPAPVSLSGVLAWGLTLGVIVAAAVGWWWL